MQKIIKVAENNVEVCSTIKMKDINNVEFEVYDKPEVYGKVRVDEELEQLLKEEEVVNNYNKKVELNKIKVKRDLLLEIQKQL